jgi:hypothetical protein
MNCFDIKVLPFLTTFNPKNDMKENEKPGTIVSSFIFSMCGSALWNECVGPGGEL